MIENDEVETDKKWLDNFWKELEGMNLKDIIKNRSEYTNYHETLTLFSKESIMVHADISACEHFMFELAVDDDILCGFDYKGRRFGLACYQHIETEISWKDIHRSIVKKHLDGTFILLGNEVCIGKYDLSMPCKEFQHKVYICGHDDTSYTRCFESEDHAQFALDQFRAKGKFANINEIIQNHNFVFTN